MRHCTHILSIIALTLTLALASCSSAAEDSGVSDPADDECEISVIVDTGRMSPADAPSRADDTPWGDPYPEEQGTAMENRIDNILLYFVTPDGTSLPMTPERSAGGEGRYEYHVRISVNASYVSYDEQEGHSISGRIVALANYPGAAPSDPLNTDAFNVKNAVSTLGRIPMWGVSTVTALPVRVNQTSNAGTVKLLRSLPKITIALDEEAAALFKITDAEALEGGWHSLAYCHPSGADKAAKTDDIMIEGCVNPVEGSEDDTLGFFGLDTGKIWCYPAERQAGIRETGMPLGITVTLERIDGTGAPFSGVVYLCDYAGGIADMTTAFPSLVRNHDYRYRISLTPLEFLISFEEWIYGGKVHLEIE